MKQGATCIKKIERSEQILDAGFTLTEMWGSQCLKSREYKTAIITGDNMAGPFNPRDGFYGGRTIASKLKVQNKILLYIDVSCS